MLRSYFFSFLLPMRVEHFEKGLSYSDEELLLLAQKVLRITKYCRTIHDESSCIRVEAERRDTKKDRDQVKVMVMISLPKAILRAESRKNKVLDAVDSCTEKLESQIEKYKAKHVVRKRVREE